MLFDTPLHGNNVRGAKYTGYINVGICNMLTSVLKVKWLHSGLRQDKHTPVPCLIIPIPLVEYYCAHLVPPNPLIIAV